MNIKLEGTRIDIQKHMKAEPRRIGGVDVTFHFPSDLQITEKEKTILQNAALTCPVAKSLHPEIEQKVEFIW